MKKPKLYFGPTDENVRTIEAWLVIAKENEWPEITLYEAVEDHSWDHWWCGNIDYPVPTIDCGKSKCELYESPSNRICIYRKPCYTRTDTQITITI